MSNSPKRYTSEAIDVTYATERCIHAAECVRGLPAVFDTQQRPWVQPERAAADAVAAVVLRCPSGALHFERKDGGAPEVAPDHNVVAVQPDGPLYVSGNLRLVTPEGELYLSETRIALCRCGQSRNKPFCDNSHKAAGFADAGVFAGSEAAEGAADGADGELTIKLRTNGSLGVQGQCAVVSADGAVVRTDNTALCRCGGSANKPFCDGTHKRIGFTT